MSGFKDSSLNFLVKQKYFEQIIMLLLKSGDLVLKNKVKIENHEEKITAHIVENYLKIIVLWTVVFRSRLKLNAKKTLIEIQIPIQDEQILEFHQVIVYLERIQKITILSSVNG